MKANNDPQLLSWLHSVGVGFDCASAGEMRQVSPKADVIFANPCKSLADIAYANKKGRVTVVDCVEEVDKLRQVGWKGSVLIRLMVPDAGSEQPFSKKFGAPLSKVPAILDELRLAGVPHAGWSFHVGSKCRVASQYAEAIKICMEGRAMTKKDSTIIDVGGGFTPDPSFVEAAAVIRRCQRLYNGVRWIAEPGRFIAEPVVDLEVSVIGVKHGSTISYTVDESVYGAFSNVAFDGKKPVFISPKTGDLQKSIIFGRSCDSADLIAETMLPSLSIGDKLRVQNMGAYSMVSASEFNGFPMAERVYRS